MAQQLTIDDLIAKYIVGGKAAVDAAMQENNVSSADAVTFTDLKMDSLDVVQLAVKVQDDLGIKLSDDEFAKVPLEGQDGMYKTADKVTLGDITKIINTKLV